MSPGGSIAAAAILVACLVACSGDDDGPTAGAEAGSVQLQPSSPPAPGEEITLALVGDRGATGSACVRLERWDSGWKTAWIWPSDSVVGEPVHGDSSCPAIGLPLPRTIALALPAELDAGAWRLVYDVVGTDSGGYVFEVA